ncbi:unnamed protein product [Closterium sp. NIES-54]
MTLRPSSVPQRVALPSPPASSLHHIPNPESDLARVASPTITRLLATVVTDPSFESTATFALVTELVNFATTCRLNYVVSLITESESVCPPSVGGELALGCDILEDRQFELECLAAILPRFASMLLCPEGDQDAGHPHPALLHRGDHGSEAEIYAGAMAAQELRWLSYLLTELGERPRSPPVLYVDNKAMVALCREQRLEHRTKHIALRYVLARELQQRCHLRLAYVASQANTADVLTKALVPGDHQRFCTALGLMPTVPHLLVA